jgi:hypothetical protein
MSPPCLYDIFGEAFESVHESVSLFVVAAVEDMTLQFGAVACELGGGQTDIVAPSNWLRGGSRSPSLH